MKELYLIRHGDSEKYDISGNMFDDKTRGLSEKGIVEIITLAEHLRDSDAKVSIIFSSPFARTIETAQILSSILNSPSTEISDLIGEADFGTLPKDKETLKRVQYGYDVQSIEQAGGETIKEIENRVNIFLDKISNLNEQRIAIVSHGLTLSVMAQLLQQLDRTFENIQVIETGDYGYFLVDEESNMVAVSFQINVISDTSK